MRALAAPLLFAAAPAAAQEVVASAGPESLSVTIYRAPDRGADDEIDRWRPQGFALITETRTVVIPAGRTTIRFEGVAGNILPESAIVTGLPDGVRERNLDADLLSPRTLYDRMLGRSVVVRRTNPATGKASDVQGVIRSSANGGMVLQTAAGVEAIHCAGLPEKIVYDAVPAGLSAKPTLSVETDAKAASRVTLTLSYLAGGFDWQSDYVVKMRPDGRGADLTAWITLASSDVTSFADAGTQVVAGKLNRVNGYWDGPIGGGGGQVLAHCWPTGAANLAPPAPPPPPPPPPPPMAAPMAAMDVIVTAARREAKQEELGDLKLYRIQDRVTVASKSQKQVAMLAREAVPLSVVYVSRGWEGDVPAPQLTLRGHNRTDAGLGLPLPAGPVAVFEDGGGRDVLVGQSSLADKAVGEDVEIKLDDTTGVSTDTADLGKGRYLLTVTNANPWPIAYEARIGSSDGGKVRGEGVKLVPKDGVPSWSVEVPANGSATLRYRVKLPRD